ncbi:MAG: Calx-beta domain-containing protein, partial [Candidatus Methanomethylicaceae archaeon]
MNLKNLIFIFLAGVAIVCIGHSDVDAVPKISFATAESSGAESSNIIIEVVLSETSSDNVTVDYEVIGGTAVKGVDYKLEAGTLLFAPGETKKTIVAEMIDDDVDEKDETVIINLKSPSPNALLGGTTIHTYTILDNDTAAASFKMSSSEGEESVTPAEIEVILSNASDHPITVNYKVTGGNAKAGEDFILPDGALTFQPGEKRKKIGATIINDNVAEEDETFIV